MITSVPIFIISFRLIIFFSRARLSFHARYLVWFPFVRFLDDIYASFSKAEREPAASRRWICYYVSIRFISLGTLYVFNKPHDESGDCSRRWLDNHICSSLGVIILLYIVLCRDIFIISQEAWHIHRLRGNYFQNDYISWRAWCKCDNISYTRA